MPSKRLAMAKALLRSKSVRDIIRGAEKSPRVSRWLGAVADRLLGDVDNYRLALQSDARVPESSMVEAVFALGMPVRARGTGPVVLAVDDLGPGGAQRQVVLTAIGLRASGCSDVRIVCRSPRAADPGNGGFFRADLEQHDIPIEVLNTVAVEGTHDALLVETLGRPLAQDVAGFMALFREWQPAVVHAFLDWPNVAAGLAAHLTGVPRILLSARNLSPVHLGLHHGALRPVYVRLLETGHVALVNNSEAGAKDYTSWLGLRDGQIGVLRNGFEADYQEVPPARSLCRSRLDLPADGQIVGGIFRHAAEKDPELWLSVASLVHARRPDVRFVIFGDGVGAKRTGRRLHELGLDHIVMLRPPHRPVGNIFGAIDVLLATSQVEGTPNVMIEAAWHGVPVAATAVGGVAETMLDGITGRLVAGRDAARLADALVELLSWRRGDEDRRQRGRDLVTTRFSQDAMIAATLELYGSPQPPRS